jgi:hypothetical protein
VVRAAMPEAAVHENRDVVARKDYVWSDPSASRLDEEILAEAEPLGVKERAEPHLRSCIALTVGSHHSAYC